MTAEKPAPRRTLDGPVSFGPFRLEPDSGRLWRGDELVHLRPKTWDVLCLLAANAGVLLTKQDIITAVWGEVAIGDTMPSISVTELRRALDDDAKSPHYIETVHGRGFRFVAALKSIEAGSPVIAAPAGAPSTNAAPAGLASAGSSTRVPAGAAAQVPAAASAQTPAGASAQTPAGASAQTPAGASARTPATPSPATPSATPPAMPATAPAVPFVGRGAELRGLQDLLSGSEPRCRVALISGEAGIGKTTLVEQLVDRLQDEPASSGRPWLLGRGQCQAHFGQGYPYLPILGALRSMSQSRQDVLDLLKTTAPSWLVRLPDLLSVDDAQDLRRRTEDVPQSRVVEEMFALLRALGPVVWILEDLHWADEATLELISLIAENISLAEFWMVGTVRLADAVASAHASMRMRRDLRRRGRCREFMLEGLSETDIDHYLAARFPLMHCPDSLSERLLTRTSGNPFFLVHTIDHLLDAGALVVAASWTSDQERKLQRALDAVPATLRELVQEEISALTDAERRLLEAASLSGLETDAATTAMALDAPAGRIDATCTDLVRRTSLLVRIGETVWPSGVVSGRYAFRHALYQKVLYEDQPPAARRDAHCRIGRGLAEVFAGHDGDAAAVLADHFERGGDSDRAVEYHKLAAQQSSRRQASREAALHLRRALALLPGVQDRQRQEAQLLAQLGMVLPALEGFGDPELRSLYLRARSLQSAGADASSEFTTMAGLLLANLMQRKPEPVEELSRELVEIAANHPDPSTRVIVEMLMGAVLYHRGDLVGTIDYADRSLATALQGITLGPIDHRCTALILSGAARWQAGDLDEGFARAERALELARYGADPFNLVLAFQTLAAVHHWRGDVDGAFAMTRELAVLVREQGIVQAEACSELVEAWALQQSGQRQESRQKLEKGLAALRRHGTMMQTVYLLAVAVEVLIGLESWSEAGAVLDEANARIEDGDARWWEPELHRWRAVLLARASVGKSAPDAETCLRRALDIASQQGSSSLHLRAALILAQLRQSPRRKEEARNLLRSSLERIRGGAETRDVRAARQLLGESRA